MLHYSEQHCVDQRDGAILIADYFLAYAEPDRRRMYVDQRLAMSAKNVQDRNRTRDIFAVLDVLRPGLVSSHDWARLEALCVDDNVQ